MLRIFLSQARRKPKRCVHFGYFPFITIMLKTTLCWLMIMITTFYQNIPRNNNLSDDTISEKFCWCYFVISADCWRCCWLRPVAGMSEGPEKDVGRYLRLLGDWDGLPDHLASAITFYMVNSQPPARPGLCAAGASEEKLNQYLVLKWKGVSVIKATWEFLVLKSQSANQSFGGMFVFLGFSFQFWDRNLSGCQAVKPNTCHGREGGEGTMSFSPGSSGQILTKLQSSFGPHS